MKLNRRNTLIGLGTIVAGGGAALGTGAFSSVEADRDVSLETTGDSDALLQLEVSGELAGTGDTISIDGDDLNLDALTTYSGALTVRNNSDNSITVGITDGSVGSGQGTNLIETGTSGLSSSDAPQIHFIVSDSDLTGTESNLIDLDTDAGTNSPQVTADIVINTLGVDDTSDASLDGVFDSEGGTILFDANEN